MACIMRRLAISAGSTSLICSGVPASRLRVSSRVRATLSLSAALHGTRIACRVQRKGVDQELIDGLGWQAAIDVVHWPLRRREAPDRVGCRLASRVARKRQLSRASVAASCSRASDVKLHRWVGSTTSDLMRLTHGMTGVITSAAPCTGCKCHTA